MVSRIWFAIVCGVVVDIAAIYYRDDAIRLFISEPGVYENGVFVVLSAVLVSVLMGLMAGKRNFKLALDKVREGRYKRNYARLFLMATFFYLMTGVIAGNLKGYIAENHVGYENVAKPFENSKTVATEEKGLVQKKIFKAGVAAVSEEIISRLVLLSLLLLVLKKETWAVAVSALIFGLSHAASPMAGGETIGYVILQVLPAAIGGVFLGWVYLKIGLGTALFFHFLQDITYQFASLKTVSRPIILCVMLLSFAHLIVKVVILIRKRKHA